MPTSPIRLLIIHKNDSRALLYTWKHLIVCCISSQIWWVSSGWWKNWGCPRPTWSWKKWLSRWPVAIATLSTTGTLSRWCWASGPLCSNCKSTLLLTSYLLVQWAVAWLRGTLWPMLCQPIVFIHQQGVLWWCHCPHATSVFNLHGNKTHLYSLSIVNPSLSSAGIMCLANRW